MEKYRLVVLRREKRGRVVPEVPYDVVTLVLPLVRERAEGNGIGDAL